MMHFVLTPQGLGLHGSIVSGSVNSKRCLISTNSTKINQLTNDSKAACYGISSESMVACANWVMFLHTAVSLNATRSRARILALKSNARLVV